jgi:hypothetical protein
LRLQQACCRQHSPGQQSAAAAAPATVTSNIIAAMVIFTNVDITIFFLPRPGREMLLAGTSVHAPHQGARQKRLP